MRQFCNQAEPAPATFPARCNRGLGTMAALSVHGFTITYSHKTAPDFLSCSSVGAGSGVNQSAGVAVNGSPLIFLTDASPGTHPGILSMS